MFRSHKGRLIAGVIAAICVASIAGCGKTYSGEIPITTASEEARAAFLEGRQIIEVWRINDAREPFQRAIALDPDFAMAHLFLGVFASTPKEREHHRARAKELSGQASTAEQQYIEAVEARDSGDHKRAVQMFTKLSRAYPEDPWPSLEVSLDYGNMNELSKVEEWLERSLAARADFAFALSSLGYHHMSQGDFDKSEMYFQRQIDAHPDEPNPYDSMADLLMRAGRFDEAVENYSRAISLDPRFIMSQNKIGINHTWAGRYDEGRSAIRKAMSMATTARDRIRAQSAMMRSYLYQGDLDAALMASNEAIRMSEAANQPTRQANFEAMRASICIRMSDHDQAAEALANCALVMASADASPATTDNWRRLVLYFEAERSSGMGDFETADAKTAALLVEIKKANNDALMELYHSICGRVDIDRQDYESALDHLKETDMDDPFDNYWLALAHKGAGNTAEAGELLERVANWNQDTQRYSFVRAEALESLGN